MVKGALQVTLVYALHLSPLLEMWSRNFTLPYVFWEWPMLAGPCFCYTSVTYLNVLAMWFNEIQEILRMEDLTALI